jgi:hypothetical protein
MRFALLFSLTITLLLSGCMTFTTNMDREAIPSFSRILIVSRLPVNTSQMLAEFARSFPKNYQVCIVNADRLALINPDTLIQQKIAECGSEVMLTVNFERDYTDRIGSNGRINGVEEYLLEMKNLRTNKPFWKAIASSEYGFNPREAVVQLRNDNIISGKIPPAQNLARID